MQHSPSVDTIIEFTHRITSGISFFRVVGLLVWTLRATARGHLARVPQSLRCLFTLIEALLGALLVELGPDGAEPVAAARALSGAAS